MKHSPGNILRNLFLIILFLLAIPTIQDKFNFMKLDELNGAVVQPEQKLFTMKDWFSGEYQLKEEEYLNGTFGFRNLFIRLNNQIAFSLFNKAKANGVVIGKNNYLYEEGYINAYYGTDFIGIDSITHRIERLKFLQDTLSKLNKTIIVVFAAGKGSFYPEYIPEEYIKEKSNTNYEFYINLAKKYDLNYIDFNRYFIENKNTAKYPLYPKYGIHWSYYGACLVADSMIRYIEKIRNIDMPNLYWKDIELAEARESDYDIGNGMNLLFYLPSNKMAYPDVQIQSDSGKVKPSVLVISDSFYWTMYGTSFTKALSKNHFWFYNKQVYPEFYQNGLETNQVNLKDEINNHDIIIIMGTDASLPRIGWGFIENAYDLFKGIKKKPLFDAEFLKKMEIKRKYILTDEKWMEDIKRKAILNKLSVDSMLTLDIIWIIQNDSK